MNTEKTTQYIVSWLKDYTLKANTKGFVVGISGGIDSAVTSTLCALTGLPTLCVEMPIHQDPKQVSRGKEHIVQLQQRFNNVSNSIADLTSVFETFKNNMPETTSSDLLDLTLANTRARLRMTTLYYFAGLNQYLVAGTGNKVEDFGVGFYTKYGDGGVDLSPIADLMKSEVYALGKHLNVPNSILNAAPTDGLFGDSRTDEDQLGASYDELEWAMNTLKNGVPNNLSTREKEVLERYNKLHKANQHKMNPIPVCILPKTVKN